MEKLIRFFKEEIWAERDKFIVILASLFALFMAIFLLVHIATMEEENAKEAPIEKVMLELED